MPFPFSYVCDLLDNLHPLHVRTHPLLPAVLHKKRIDLISRWLKDRRNDLNAFNTQSGAALWVLRPDKLGGRHYGISATTLQLIIGRTYRLSREEMKTLRRWETQPHLGDLATCVAVVRDAMQGIPAPTKMNQVTVEEIQNTMLRIASKNPESSPEVRSLSSDEDRVNPLDLLQNIYERLSSRETKWMTRYIMKDYGAILLPDSWTWEPGHFGLPNCAPIKFDLFTQDPPVEILDGTRRVKATAATRAAAEKERLETEGWSRPPPRSREPSPIARPRLKAREASVTEPSRSRTEMPSTRSRDFSPDSGPMIWQTGILKPNAKRKRTEVSSTPVQLPAKASLNPSINPVPTMLNGINTPIVTLKQCVRPATVGSSGSSELIAQAKNPCTNPIAVGHTSISLVKMPRSSTTVTPSIVSKASKAKMTHIFIDMTESPPRSGFSTTPPVASSPKKSSSPPRTVLKGMTSSAISFIPSRASTIPTPSRTALSNLPLKAASRNSQISLSLSNHLPTPNPNPSNLLITAGTGKCCITKHECPLIRCIVLLSPSLTTLHHPLHNYLVWHGLQYMTDPKALSHPHLPKCCPTTNLRYRKIVLVDMYNPKETAILLSEIEDLNLQHRVKRGKRDIKGNEWTKEFVEVYDWKILEAMGKVDQGKRFKYDPWERCLVLPV